MTVEPITLSKDEEGFIAALSYGITYRVDNYYASEVAQNTDTIFDVTVPNDTVLALLLGDV